MATSVAPSDIATFLTNVAWAIRSTYHTVLNSLTAMWRQDAAFFNELRARVITPRIFGRC